MMSQRAQSRSIMQLTLPDGETKPVSSGDLAIRRCRADQIFGLRSGFGRRRLDGGRRGRSGLRDCGAATAGGKRQHRGEPGNGRYNTVNHRATITRCVCAQWCPRGFGSKGPHVLVFDVVRPVRSAPGLVAQRESVRLTRGRSLVRSQSGPPTYTQLRACT